MDYIIREVMPVVVHNNLACLLYTSTAMQMGVANYGQMTAGGWMYIGPQGIVHGLSLIHIYMAGAYHCPKR